MSFDLVLRFAERGIVLHTLAFDCIVHCTALADPRARCSMCTITDQSDCLSAYILLTSFIIPSSFFCHPRAAVQ